MASRRSDEELRALMEPVARELLGEPNRALSTPKILRWGRRGSLVADLEKGAFFDNEAGEGGGVIALIEREVHGGRAGAWEWLDRRYPKTNGAGRANGAKHAPGVIEATYPYRDADGKLLFEVVRWRPKRFSQRRPDGVGGWIWDLKGVKPVLYRLPELLAEIAQGRTVWIVEGEKDVERLRQAGLSATCNPGGTHKWKPSFNAGLRGADVIVVADNDDAGRDHAAKVAQALTGVARRVRLLDLGAECDLKGDVSDFLDRSKTVADLEALAEALADFAAAPLEVEAPEFSDSSLAEAFAAQDDDGRFDHAWRTWDGARWRDDGELRVLAALRGWIKREVIPDASAKDRIVLGASHKLHGVEHELRLLRRVEPDVWDAQPWLLNCPDGTWDLRGKPYRREHRREDLLTQVTAVSPGGECPQWREFIGWATQDDPDLAYYLQKLAGYALIGKRLAQMFAFFYGSGSNGKGVYLQVLTAILGDYAAVVMADVFLEQRYERHSEELMPLRGARLVTASEVPEDAAWNEARVKAVTGGDIIRARYMRENSVEFRPTALLILSGNVKPTLKSVDEAIKRRIHLVEFAATIDDAHREEELAERLAREEGPGILAWMMEGCRAVQAEGLTRPAAVKAATDDYLESADHLRSWVGDHCEAFLEEPTRAKTPVNLLFANWKAYAQAGGIRPGTINSFSSRLAKLGFQHVRSNTIRSFYGIRLKNDQGE